jgi:hypothetical protein
VAAPNCPLPALLIRHLRLASPRLSERQQPPLRAPFAELYGEAGVPGGRRPFPSYPGRIGFCESLRRRRPPQGPTQSGSRLGRRSADDVVEQVLAGAAGVRPQRLHRPIAELHHLAQQEHLLLLLPPPPGTGTALSSRFRCLP